MKKKKIKEIKAEQYNENEEVDVEIDIEDDSYEDDYNEDREIEVVVEKNNDFEVTQENEIIEYEEEYEEAKKTFRRANNDKFMKIFNIIFIILIIIMILIGVDVICVARYDIGPFFAIKTRTYKDGGTKVYHGLGYKVIKYHQIEGRRDTQIGFWNMPYLTEPTPIEDIDLAIEFQNNPEKTSEKYYKQYLKITSKIKEVAKEENKLVLEYTDEDGKYTLQIDCPLASSKEELTNFKEQQEVTIRGTVYKFSIKNEDKSNAVYLSDCFAEVKQ